MNLVLASGYCSMPRKWCDNEGKKSVSFLEEEDIYYVFASKSVSSRVCVLMAAQAVIRTF